MTVKELIVLAHFLKDQFGEKCEVLAEFQDESFFLNGGFRVDDRNPNEDRKVVLL